MGTPPAPSEHLEHFSIHAHGPIGGIARALAISLPNGETLSMLAPSSPSGDWELFVRDLLAALERDGSIAGYTFPDH